MEGNMYLDASMVINSTVSNSIVVKSAISQSSIDMLSSSGNLQLITNAQNPVNPQDVATKNYVDTLGYYSNFTLTGTSGTLINSIQSGSFVITVTNLALNAPSAVFNLTKNNSLNNAHIVRVVAAPGTSDNFLLLEWPISSGIYLRKTKNFNDGSYTVKII